MIKRIATRIRRLPKERIREYASPIMASYSAVALSFAANFVLARQLGAASFGLLAIWTNWAMLLAVFGNLGIPILALRHASAHEMPEELSLAFYQRSFTVMVLGTIMFAIPTGVIVYLSALETQENSTIAWRVIAAITILALTMATLRLGSLTLRVRGSPALSVITDQVWKPIAFLLAATLLLIAPVSVQGILWIVQACCLLCAVFVFRTLRINPLAVTKRAARTDLGSVLRSSLPFWFSDLAIQIVKRSDVIVIGLIASPAVAGLFVVAERVAQLPNIATNAVDTLIGPKFSAIAHLKDKSAMGAVMRESLFVTIGLGLPICVILYMAAPYVMALAGPEFTSGSGALRIMLLAVLIEVATRPMLSSLMMGGEERGVARIQWLVLPLHLACFAVLAWQYGVVGAAVARVISVTSARIGLSSVAILRLRPTQ